MKYLKNTTKIEFNLAAYQFDYEKEYLSQLAARQRKFIENLENALVRIENKTYGICRVTGKLISKERLRAVPHTTLSMEAKLQQYK
jgi:RNA polymerase-binding transcription factor DksA